jgi:hypothetical protein
MALSAADVAAMVGTVTEILPGTVTIQVNTPTRTGSGAEVPAWANVGGLVNLPAEILPAASQSGVSANEQRSSVRVLGEADYVCTLAGVYSTITRKHRLIAAGVAYDITGVSVDAYGITTLLGLRLASV